MVKFQSTHLHEVWRWVYMKIIRLRMFQSTHLHEVWPNAVFSMASAYLFQSTHLHEVWPPLFHFTSHVKEFQSTHLHEVWQSWQFSHDLINSFNPHTYMRCDNIQLNNIGWEGVSIHTPTWGVTSNSMYCVIPPMFQSTHLHEVWRLLRLLLECIKKFQSTHLHEVWLISFPISYNRLSFNPHTYMRCDS